MPYIFFLISLSWDKEKKFIHHRTISCHKPMLVFLVKDWKVKYKIDEDQFGFRKEKVLDMLLDLCEIYQKGCLTLKKRYVCSS